MLKVQYSLTDLKKTKYFLQLIQLEEELFTTTLESIYQFDQNLLFSFIVNDFDNLVAFVVYKDHQIAYDIFKIGVTPFLQKKEYGKMLLDTLLDKDIVLEVSTKNITAINFYEKNGFIQFQILPGYYKGVDGVKMIRRKL